MAPDPVESLSTLQGMIKREPTVPMTAKERKKEFRIRAKEMQRRKSRAVVLSEMLNTKDSDLRRVREGASTTGLLGYSQFVETFRQKRIEMNNNKINK